MKFKHQDKLDAFLNEIDHQLLDEQNLLSVAFPSNYVSSWDGVKLAQENEALLASASGKANVYMLFTSIEGSAG